jgi:hypothetical protein
LYEAIQRKHPQAEPSFLTDEEIASIQNPSVPDDIPTITADRTLIAGIIKSLKSLVKAGLDKNRFEHLW